MKLEDYIGLDALLKYWELYFNGVDDRDMPKGLRQAADVEFRRWNEEEMQ